MPLRSSRRSSWRAGLRRSPDFMGRAGRSPATPPNFSIRSSPRASPWPWSPRASPPDSSTACCPEGPSTGTPNMTPRWARPWACSRSSSGAGTRAILPRILLAPEQECGDQQAITAVLGGYVTDRSNPFVRDPEKTLAALVKLG